MRVSSGLFPSLDFRVRARSSRRAGCRFGRIPGTNFLSWSGAPLAVGRSSLWRSPSLPCASRMGRLLARRAKCHRGLLRYPAHAAAAQ